MYKQIKQVVRALMPHTYQRFRDRYNRDARLTRAIIRRQGLVVASGPFAGVLYIEDSHGSRLVPKLLGSYEIELHDVIAEILARCPSVVVDVGCAEGYYAVGFARALPNATIYAYDIDCESRELCAKLATLNGVTGNLIIREACDYRELDSLPLDDALIMCDCEGYELELLCPDKTRNLLNAYLLIELHDCFVPGITQELMRRFEKTHVVRLIDIKQRDPDVYLPLRGMQRSMQSLALYERDTNTTPPQQWAYMVPKKETK